MSDLINKSAIAAKRGLTRRTLMKALGVLPATALLASSISYAAEHYRSGGNG